jgi:hypothetical protein
MRGAAPIACEECRDLTTHEFRSADDLLHAVQTAAAEVDRGVLRRVAVPELTTRESEALDSALASQALPDLIRYRFECTQCGDAFELVADTSSGQGAWTRQERPAR